MHRRQLLKAGVSAAALVSFAGITTGIPKPARAAIHQFDFQAVAIDQTLPAATGATIPMWQFVDAANPAPPFATEIRVLAGDSIVISLTNSLSIPVNIIVPGILDTSPACPPGATMTYVMVAPSTPGTYIFHDDVNGILGRAMGLAGALVVGPADGSMAYAGGQTFTREHSLTFAEIDTRLNEAVAAGQSYDIANYEPNYFFVNGQNYLKDVSGVELQMSVGEDVAFRMINAGLIYYPMHFHGYHPSVINRNSSPELFVRDKDTIMIPPNETVEAVLNVDKSGLYPLHTHYLPGVTNNGVYAGGGLIIMNAA